MAVPIAELFISVSADVNAAISGLTGLENKLKSTTQRFSDAKPAALALTAAAAGIGAVFGSAVNVAADFEHQMAAVKSVMTPGEVEQFGVALKDLALKLGRDTVFTSREAAAAIEELVKAGLPVESVLNGAAAAALNLAAATGVSTAEAASITGQALNTFKLNASQATDVVDRLSGVANKSASDISFLGFGMASVGGVAAGLGLSFDDTAVGLGLMSKSFKTGADAGTSFKRFLETLQPRSKAQIQLADKLGITTNGVANAFFDAGGHVKNLTGLAGVLQTAFRGMTDEQRQFAEGTLFGSDAIRAAEAIYQAGAAGVRQFSDDTGQSGTAAASAQTRMDSLQGALQSLGGSFETIQITVGDLFLPALRGIADAVKGALDAFSAMSPGAQNVVVGLIGVVGAAAGLAGGVGIVGLAIRTLGPSFLALGKILVSLSPAFRIVTLVAGVLAAAWATNFGNIRGLVSRVFEAIPGILDRVSKAFSDAGDFWNTTIAPALQNIADTVGQKFGELAATVQASGLGQAVAGAFGVVGDVFQAIMDGRGGQIIDFFGNLLPQPFKDLGAAIGPQVGNAFGVISDVFQAIIDGRGGEIIDFFGNLLPQPLKDLGAAIGEPVRHAFDAISAIFQAIVSGRGGLVIDFFKTQLPQPFKDLGVALQGPVETAFTAISTIFQAIVSGKGQLILDYFKAQLPESFVTFGASVGENIGHAFEFISQIFTAIISGNGQLVVDFFKAQLPQALQDFIDKAGEAPAAVNQLAASLTTIQGSIGNFDPGRLATLGEALGGSFLNTLSSIGTSLAPLAPVFQSVGGFLASIGNVFSAFADLRAKQTAAGQGATGDDPLVSSLQRLADFLAQNGNIGDLFVGALGPMGAPLAALASSRDAADTFTNMANGLNQFATAIRNLPPLPDWVQKILDRDVIGLAQNADVQKGMANALLPQLSNPLLHKEGFGGAGAGGGSPLVQIGQLIISNEAEAEAFLARMAEAVRGSAGRVNAPPDNSGNPQLGLSFA